MPEEADQQSDSHDGNEQLTPAPQSGYKSHWDKASEAEQQEPTW